MTPSSVTQPVRTAPARATPATVFITFIRIFSAHLHADDTTRNTLVPQSPNCQTRRPVVGIPARAGYAATSVVSECSLNNEPVRTGQRPAPRFYSGEAVALIVARHIGVEFIALLATVINRQPF